MWKSVWDDNAEPPVNDFTKKMECGQCIKQGNWYCVKVQSELDKYKSSFSGEANEPLGVCCHDRWNCPVMGQSDWECSNIYADEALALGMCPADEERCGASDIELSDPGTAADCSIKLDARSDNS